MSPKTKIHHIFILILIITLTACSPKRMITDLPPDASQTGETEGKQSEIPGGEVEENEPQTNQWAPIPQDDTLSRGEAFIDLQEIDTSDTQPAQYTLVLKGSLPTPCHKLRVMVMEPDENNRLQVEVYSVMNPTEFCIQVLEPFEAEVPLGTFPAGAPLTVWVNGEMLGEIYP